jgi:hypothetical protein
VQWLLCELVSLLSTKHCLTDWRCRRVACLQYCACARLCNLPRNVGVQRVCHFWPAISLIASRLGWKRVSAHVRFVTANRGCLAHAAVLHHAVNSIAASLSVCAVGGAVCLYIKHYRMLTIVIAELSAGAVLHVHASDGHVCLPSMTEAVPVFIVSGWCCLSVRRVGAWCPRVSSCGCAFSAF